MQYKYQGPVIVWVPEPLYPIRVFDINTKLPMLASKVSTAAKQLSSVGGMMFQESNAQSTELTWHCLQVYVFKIIVESHYINYS